MGADAIESNVVDFFCKLVGHRVQIRKNTLQYRDTGYAQALNAYSCSHMYDCPNAPPMLGVLIDWSKCPFRRMQRNK